MLWWLPFLDMVQTMFLCCWSVRLNCSKGFQVWKIMVSTRRLYSEDGVLVACTVVKRRIGEAFWVHLQQMRECFRGWSANVNGEIRRTKEELLTSLDKLELLQEREGIGARGVGVRWLLISLGFPDRPERVVARSSKKETVGGRTLCNPCSLWNPTHLTCRKNSLHAIIQPIKRRKSKTQYPQLHVPKRKENQYWTTQKMRSTRVQKLVDRFLGFITTPTKPKSKHKGQASSIR